MSDIIGLVMEWILGAKWPRRVVLGGILAVIIGMGGFGSPEGRIGLTVVGGLFVFLEGLDHLATKRGRAGRGGRGRA